MRSHSVSAGQKSTDTHAALFYDDGRFRIGATDAKKTGKPFPYRLVSGIIPHHLYASTLLSGFFQGLSGQKPRRIILLGPNHRETGKYPVITSLRGWNTPFGTVRADMAAIRPMVSSGFSHVDETVSEYEHSVGGIMPYIAYYIPDARVVPLILSGRMSYDEIMEAANVLSHSVDRDTIVLSSVDFSHYLPGDEAQKRDAITETYMKAFSYRQLYPLNNEYLDSAASVIIALRVAELLHAVREDIVAHTNSGTLQNNETIPTTSYFTVALHE